MHVCVKMMSKGSKEALTVLTVTHVTQVKSVKYYVLYSVYSGLLPLPGGKTICYITVFEKSSIVGV